MERIEKFIKKYNDVLTLLLVNILILLGILTILKVVGLANISVFISFKYIVLAGVFTVFLIIAVIYQRLTPNIKKIFNIIFVISMFLLLGIQVLPLLGINITTSLPFLGSINIFSYGRCINLLLLLNLLLLFFFNWRNIPEENSKYEHEKLPAIILLLLIACYLIVEFSLLKYSGNYPDEYHHLLSGESLINGNGFPELNMYFGGKGYLKGAPMSYLVALFFSVFGVSLKAGKLAPITLGLLNLLLLNQISRRMIESKIIRVLSLLLFIFSPWLVFNHFYIRHYVFIEFSLLLIIFLSIKLSETIEKNSKKAIIYSSLLIGFNLLYFFLMNDSTKYLIPFASICGLIYIFVHEDFQLKRKLSKFLKRSISKRKSLIWLLTLIIFCLGIYFIYSNNLLTILFDGETNTVSTHYNIKTFFLGLYSFFTVFTFIGLLITILKRNKGVYLIYYLFIPLFLLHAVSSESMQVMRGLVYLLPIFFVLSCYGLEQVISFLPKNRNYLYIFITLFSLVSLQILSKDKDLFLPGTYPIFPREIGYSNYQSLYKYINEKLDSYTIIYVGYNDQHSSFWDTEIDYKIDFKNTYNKEISYSTYWDKYNNTYRQYFSNTEIILKRDTYLNILKEDNVCIILSAPGSPSFLLNSDTYRIKRNLIFQESFEGGYSIYCED